LVVLIPYFLITGRWTTGIITCKRSTLAVSVGSFVTSRTLQHLGGTSLVERVVDSLTGSDGSILLLDLLGYDAWPALYTLSKSASGLLVLHFVFFNLLCQTCFFSFFA